MQPGIDKSFDYLLPESLAGRVHPGSLVRVPLHGRRVGAWVLELDVTPPAGVTLLPIAKLTGWGPPPEILELSKWAAWRWAGRRASLLRTGSPAGAVRRLPESGARRRPPAARMDAGGARDDLVDAAFASGRAVLRLPPAADLSPVALAAAERGNALVITPSVEAAHGVASSLRDAGVVVASLPEQWALARAGATVVGTRAAAWAPVVDLAAVVVLDEHDQAHKQEQSPNWHARDVAAERARRAGVPCVLTSPVPSLEALGWGWLHVPSRSEERFGWAKVEVVDRRGDDPRTGLVSERLARVLGEGGRIVCVLNRKGRSRLLVCRRCGRVADCESCQSAVGEDDDSRLVCARCGTRRPAMCLACGSSAFANLRVGVRRLREELEALVRAPVLEVTGDRPGDGVGAHEQLAAARVLVGTEAVLHQVRAADVVAFLDLDQELLAPRYRAAEEAMGLVARAARLVGGRRGRLLLQTRMPEHEVVRAALRAEPGLVSAAELERRQALRFPPLAAVAAVSGPAAEAFLELLGSPLGVEVWGPSDGRWVVRAANHRLLCDALAAAGRPAGRLRVEVDPLRL